MKNFERNLKPEEALNIGKWHNIPIKIKDQLLKEAITISDSLKENNEVNLRGIIFKNIEEIEDVLYDFYDGTNFIEDKNAPEDELFEGKRAPNNEEIDFIKFKIKEFLSA